VSLESVFGDIDFPAVKNGRSTTDLLKGDYEAEFIVIDDTHSNDTVRSTFRIAYDNDIRPDYISLFEWKHENMGKPIEVYAAARNIGTLPQSMVNLDVEIKDKFGALVYQDNRNTSIPVGEKRGFKFDDFTPTRKGGYTITFVARSTSEDDHTDDLLEYTLSLDDNVHDASLISPMQPRMNGVIGLGQPFIPSVKANYEGLWPTDPGHVHVSVIIRDCEFGQRVFASSLDATIFGTETIDLPNESYFEKTSGLPEGCYVATFVITHSEDAMRADDTLSVPFSISSNAEVYELSNEGSVKFNQYSDRIEVVIAEPISFPIQWTLYNVGGLRVGSGSFAAGSRSVDVPTHSLSAGAYILELGGPENPTHYRFIWP
jgi:hypothetical protein